MLAMPLYSQGVKPCSVSILAPPGGCTGILTQGPYVKTLLLIPTAAPKGFVS